jgi:hypothetical protein
VKAEEKITENRMPGEDEELAEEKDSPMAEGELPVTVKKAAVPKLQGQQKKEIALEEVGHISEEEEMAEAEELPIQCYRCHKWGHRSFECPEAEQAGQRGAYVAQPEEAEAPPQEVENVARNRGSP